MKHFFVIKEDHASKILEDSTYDEILILLKNRNPNSNLLTDDEELSKLHDLYALLKAGHINVSYDYEQGLRILEV